MAATLTLPRLTLLVAGGILLTFVNGAACRAGAQRATAPTTAPVPSPQSEAPTCPVGAYSQPTAPPTGDLKPDALSAITDGMWSFVNASKVPGAALAVAYHGEVVYSGGFGFANVDARQPVKRTSLFRIASLSKSITAAAIFQLVERNRLNLQDHPFDLLHIDPWLEPGSQSDRRLKDITVYHLLTHTGGWDRDRSTDPLFGCITVSDALGIASPPDRMQFLRYISGRTLDYNPGVRYAYSNVGYCLLGRLIEHVTGMPYEQYVRQEILAPVCIRDMRVGGTLECQLDPDEVHYYAADNAWGPPVVGPNRQNRAPRVYGAWSQESLDSAAGWIASAEDLAIFCASFDKSARRRILSESLANQMLTPPSPLPLNEPKDGREPYACGWSVLQGEGEVWNDGLLEGSSTIMVRRPNGVSWAIVFNSDFDADGRELSALAYDQLRDVLDSVPAMLTGANSRPTKATSRPSAMATLASPGRPAHHSSSTRPPDSDRQRAARMAR